MAEMEETGLKIITWTKTFAMVTFAELVETVEHLSEDEIDELREILRRKKEEEIFKAVEEARKESEEGRTIVLSSPKEIERFFNNLMNENSYI